MVRPSVLAVLILITNSTVWADEQTLTTENYLIPAADPGIQLFIRNKHPEGITTFRGVAHFLNEVDPLALQ